MARKHLELVIAGDARQALKAISDVQQSAGKLQKGFGGVVKGLDQLGGQITRKLGTAAKWVGGLAAAAVGAAITGGVARLTNIEDAQAKLRGLGHDAKTVDQVMQDALASVKGTAFGLDTAATTAAGAIAAGIKPGQDLERTLKLVADTATIAGAGMDEMGAIFNKVAAANRLSMGEVNQLADRGVPILQMIADQYGVTAAEARKMVEQGKVDFNAFRDALESNIAGAALESGSTTRGAFANMIAAASRFGAALAGPLFGQVRGFFVGATEWIDGLTEAVGPFAERIGEWVPRAFKQARDVAEPIIVQLRAGVSALVKSFSGEAVAAEGFAGIMGRIGAAARGLVGWLTENRDAIERVVQAVIPAVGALGTLAVSVHGLIRVFNLLKVATPVGLLLTLASALLYAWQNSATFRNVVTSAVQAVQRVVQPAMSAVVNAVRGLGSSTSQTGNWLRTTWASIGRIFTSALDAIRVVVTLATKLIDGVWRRFGDGILRFIRVTWDNIRRTIDGALRIIQGILDVFVGVLTGDWRRAWDGIKNIVSGAWQIVRSVISQSFNVVRSIFGAGIATLQTLWSGLWTGVRNVASSAIGALKGAFRGAVSALGNIWNGLRNAMARPINWVIDNVINKFLGGVRSVASALNVKLSIPDLPRIPTFHEGGVVGRDGKLTGGPLRPGERLIKVLDGEEVLTRDDPRHIANRRKHRDLLRATDEGNPPVGGPLDWIRRATHAVVSSARELIAKVARPAVEAALGLIDGMTERFGLPGRLIGGVARTLGHKVLDWIAGVDEEASKKAGDLGGKGWRALVGWLRQAGVPFVLTSTLRRGNRRSKHYYGLAADFSIAGHGNRGYGHAGLRRIFEAFLPVQHQLSELILAGAPFNIKNGRRVPGYAWGRPGQPGNHWNHVHAATFDVGGLLKPGWTLAFNGTGRAERVMSGRQEDALVRTLARIERVLDRLERQGGAAPVIHVHGVEDGPAAGQAVAVKLRSMS